MTTVISWRMIDAVTYGMIPSANSEKRDERAAREEVEQAEDGAALAAEVALDRLGVDARRRHPRAEPVEREDHRREEDPAAELRDAPGVGEPGEHPATPRRRSGSAGVSAGFRSAPASRARFFLRGSAGSLSAVARAAGGLDLLARGRRERRAR